VTELRATLVTASHLGRFGLGGPALQVERTLHEHFAPSRVLCYGGPGSDDPRTRRTIPRPWGRRRLGRLRLPRAAWLTLSTERRRFDRRSARELEPTELLLVENGAGQACMESAVGRDARRVLLVHNEHHSVLRRALVEEDRRWGLRGNFLDESLVRRQDREIEMADAVICFSRRVEKGYVEAGVSPQRLHRVEFGVDASRFAPAAAPSSSGRWTVAFVGWLSAHKGFPYLIQAVRALDDPGCELLLHGGTDLIENHRLAARLGAGVAWRVVRGDVTETMQRASVVVLPSVSDGFGLVVLEAMACGVPVIATDRCGAAEVIRDGVDGFVVPARDAVAIEDRLRTLRSDDELRREMGRRARESAQKRTWSAFRAQLRDVLEHVVDAGTRRPRAAAGQRRTG
jgi:glycosyltransferase involved in cell wall biosynthesis